MILMLLLHSFIEGLKMCVLGKCQHIYANIHVFYTLPVEEKLTKDITKSLNEYESIVYRN